MLPSGTRAPAFSHLQEVAMEDLPLSGLKENERKLLAVFVRHGRDGRAITMESLAANAHISTDSPELTTALKNLAARGFVKRAGGDPIPGAPVAFRLSVARQHFGGDNKQT
jgi:hypothetical protein